MSDSSKPGFSYSYSHLQQLASDVLACARESGASACEVDISEGFGQSVAVRCGEVETIEHNRDKGIGVSIYLGQRKGHASTSDFSAHALRETVAAAINIARFTQDDACAGLPEPELLAQTFPNLDLYHPWSIPVEEAIELARQAEEAAFAVSPKISNSEGASLSMQESQFVAANSLGFMGGYPTSRHYIACSAIAGKSDEMQRDDWFDSHRVPSELMDPKEIGRIAANRALARLGARPVKTCEVPVLFEAPIAGSLISSFVHAVSGGSLYRKTSFLVDSLGQPVFAPCVHIEEDPFLARAFGSSPFDSDCVATRARSVVSDGILQGYFLSVYSGRKLGLKTTGNAGGSHNLLVRPGHDDYAGLIKKMGRGLIVTELLGHGINYLTGDYSRGVAGFWVEDGVIAHPVEEITIAGNLREMFGQIVGVGNDVLCRGAKYCGSILIEKMKIAGN